MAVDTFREQVRQDLVDAGFHVTEGGTITNPNGVIPNTQPTRITPARQIALPGIFANVEEETTILLKQVSEKADRILAVAEQGAFSETTKIGFQFATAAGVLMDAILTLKIDAKPSKVED